MPTLTFKQGAVREFLENGRVAFEPLVKEYLLVTRVANRHFVGGRAAVGKFTVDELLKETPNGLDLLNDLFEWKIFQNVVVKDGVVNFKANKRYCNFYYARSMARSRAKKAKAFKSGK